MEVIVCIKQVPDPESPQEYFVIDSERNRVQPQGIPPVLSLFDENALEAALRIKDGDRNNVKITVLSLGKRISDAVMQKALATGADSLVKVEDEIFDSGNLDSYTTSFALASAIKKIGRYDLIFVGRQAADWNSGQTCLGIAEALNLPAITLARKVEIDGSAVKVERMLATGYEVVRCPLPAIIMASNEVGVLRYPTLIQRREAKRKPVTRWKAEDIGFDGTARNKVVIKRLYAPEVKKRKCEIIEGTSPADAGKRVAERLIEAKVV